MNRDDYRAPLSFPYWADSQSPRHFETIDNLVQMEYESLGEFFFKARFKCVHFILHLRVINSLSSH